MAVADLDGDQRADLVAGAAYPGRTLTAGGPPRAAFDVSVYPGFTGGVFVG